MPYGRLKNTEVVERVQRGIILERPKASTKEIYDVSKNDSLGIQTISNMQCYISGDEKMLGAQSRRSTFVP